MAWGMLQAMRASNAMGSTEKNMGRINVIAVINVTNYK